MIVVAKAKTACAVSSHAAANHFVGFNKMVGQTPTCRHSTSHPEIPESSEHLCSRPNLRVSNKHVNRALLGSRVLCTTAKDRARPNP